MESRATSTLPDPFSEPSPEEPGKRKTTTSRGEIPPGYPPITPTQRFRFEHQKATFAFWVAGASLALALVAIIFVATSVGREEKVFVLDAAGNMHYGPLIALSKNQDVLQTVSVLATQTVLSRSSVGFDLQEFLRPIFNPKAMRILQEDMDDQSKDLRTRSIHQSPVIEEIKGPVSAGFAKRMEISGKVIRSGVYNNRAIYEEAPYTLVLSFTKNPNIGDVACYPWVVSDIEIKIGQAQ